MPAVCLHVTVQRQGWSDLRHCFPRASSSPAYDSVVGSSVTFLLRAREARSLHEDRPANTHALAFPYALSSVEISWRPGYLLEKVRQPEASSPEQSRRRALRPGVCMDLKASSCGTPCQFLKPAVLNLPHLGFQSRGLQGGQCWVESLRRSNHAANACAAMGRTRSEQTKPLRTAVPDHAQPKQPGMGMGEQHRAWCRV